MRYEAAAGEKGHFRGPGGAADLLPWVQREVPRQLCLTGEVQRVAEGVGVGGSGDGEDHMAI